MKSKISPTTDTETLASIKKNRLLSIFLATLKWLILFLVIYTLMNWWRQPIMPSGALALEMSDYKDQSIDLSAMSHKSPVLIYFWGTWCGVCSVSSPKVNTLNEQGYPVVSIAVKSGSDQDIQQYMMTKKYNFPVVNDSEGVIFNSWQGQVTPSYVILHRGKAIQGMAGIQPIWVLKSRLWLSNL